MMKSSVNQPFLYAPPSQDAIDVLYDDGVILALNKPSGLLSVPGKTENLADCLESRVKKTYPSATIVHRLDMDTSGVMIMALTRQAHQHISLQFEKRETKKTYIARVWGHVKKDEGHIDLPMICDWPNRPIQKICHEHGRPAQTDWAVIERNENETRMALYPKTGRSHQLRVHMLSLGHPILGDRFYAHEDALNAARGLLQLHAQSLTLSHPKSDETMCFTAPCPF